MHLDADDLRRLRGAYQVTGAFFGLFVCVVLTCGVGEVPTALWVVIPGLTGLASAYFGNAFRSWVLQSFWWMDWLSWW